MRQSWGKEDIEKRLELIRLGKDNCYDSVTMLQRILSDLKRKERPQQGFVDKKYFFYALKRFNINYFDSSFIKMVDYISPRLEKLDLDFRDIDSQYESADVVQDMCKVFFKRGEKSSFTFYKKLMVNSEDRFRLDREGSLPFSGRTYFLDDNDFYVLISGINSLHEMTVAVHEIKHIENVHKGYNKGAMLYEELPSLLHQLYALDFLLFASDDYSTSLELLRRHFIKYIKMILDIKRKSDIVRSLLTDENFYLNLDENYDVYYELYNLGEVFNFLRFGITDVQIGYIVSFLASIDIYLNCERKNSENALSGYLFGLYKIKPHMINNNIDYFETVLGVKDDYEKNHYKILI